MAACTLYFDDEQDGEVTASIAFFPPLPEGVARPLLTNAQQLGMRLREAAFRVQEDLDEENIQEENIQEETGL